MIPRRERIALRADKWWASVWLKQMCMDQRGVEWLKPLTDRVWSANLLELKRNDLTDGPTDSKERTK